MTPREMLSVFGFVAFYGIIFGAIGATGLALLVWWLRVRRADRARAIAVRRLHDRAKLRELDTIPRTAHGRRYFESRPPRAS